MAWMFAGAIAADPDTSQWDTSSVTSMQGMFLGASSADPDTSQWDTASVVEINEMFKGAVSARPDTSLWDTSSVTTMAQMFAGAISANPDTSQWNTSGVTDMTAMFFGAASANPDTSNWTFAATTTDMFLGMCSAHHVRLAQHASCTPCPADEHRIPVAWDQINADTYKCSSCPGVTISHPGRPCFVDPDAFRAELDISKADATLVIQLPFPTTAPPPGASGFAYNCTIDWGDGSAVQTFQKHPNTAAAAVEHAYPDGIKYNISISGVVQAMDTTALSNGNWRAALTHVFELGKMDWRSLSHAFTDCSNLLTVAGGDTSGVTDMSFAFQEASSLEPSNPDTSKWDTSSVTTMNSMFRESSADPHTSRWNTSSVTDMASLFEMAHSAKPDTRLWDTASVTSMAAMFKAATSADPDTSLWDMSSVSNVENMFGGAASASADTSCWNVSGIPQSQLSSFSPTPGLARQTGESNEECVKRRMHDFRAKIDLSKANGLTIQLPFYPGHHSGHSYDFTVLWGDGSPAETFQTPPVTHTYPSNSNSSRYSIAISGTASGMNAHQANEDWRKALTHVVELGSLGWTNLHNAFRDCTNLLTVLGGDTSSVTDMSFMFSGAHNVEPDTSKWNTSAVISMREMFAWANKADPITTFWDTSAVTDMWNMFRGASSANPDTSRWNTSSVMHMREMFREATRANPETGRWNTSLVTNMDWMFAWADAADPNTTFWNVSAVMSMQAMFESADLANPDTSRWDVSSVTNMLSMFNDARSANPDTSLWDVSSVTNMRHMFQGAVAATPDTSQWDTSSVHDMAHMFEHARIANPNTKNWDTSSAHNMHHMFHHTESLATKWALRNLPEFVWNLMGIWRMKNASFDL